MIPCYVINLKRSTSRLAAFQSAARRHGWIVERLEAIDKVDLEIQSLNDPSTMRIRHRTRPELVARAELRLSGGQEPLHEGNYACILSHVELWRKLVASNEEAYVVFEDDAIIEKAFDLTDIPEDADFVCLSDRVSVVVPEDLDPADFSAWIASNRYAPLYPGCGTEAYIVTRSGAEKGLALIDPIMLPIDLQLFAHAHGAVACNHSLASFRQKGLPLCNIYATTVTYASHRDHGMSDSLRIESETQPDALMHQVLRQEKELCSLWATTVLSQRSMHRCLSLPNRKDRRFVFQRGLPDVLHSHVTFHDALDRELIYQGKIDRLKMRFGLEKLTRSNQAVRFSKRRILREFLYSAQKILFFYEDDAAFSPRFLHDAHLLLTEMPYDWDIGVLGGQCPHADVDRATVMESPPTADNHCLIFSRQGARKVLKALRAPSHAYSDQVIKDMIKKKEIIAYWTGSYTVWQRGSTSDNWVFRDPDPYRFNRFGMFAGEDDVHLLASSVSSGDTVLEWGAGGSTLLMAYLVGDEGKVTSIEHLPKYFDKTKAGLETHGLSHRVDLILKTPRPYRELDGPWRMLPRQMDDYVRAARSRCEPESVDVVFIDGRERIRCVHEALPLLRPEGYLLIHDFWGRARYREAISTILLEADLLCSTPRGERDGKVTDMALFQKRRAQKATVLIG